MNDNEGDCMKNEFCSYSVKEFIEDVDYCYLQFLNNKIIEVPGVNADSFLDLIKKVFKTYSNDPAIPLYSKSVESSISVSFDYPEVTKVVLNYYKENGNDIYLIYRQIVRYVFKKPVLLYKKAVEQLILLIKTAHIKYETLNISRVISFLEEKEKFIKKYGLNDLILDLNCCYTAIIAGENAYTSSSPIQEREKDLNRLMTILSYGLNTTAANHSIINSAIDFSKKQTENSLPKIANDYLQNCKEERREQMKFVINYSLSFFVSVNKKVIEDFVQTIVGRKLCFNGLKIANIVMQVDCNNQENDFYDRNNGAYGLREFVIDLDEYYCKILNKDRVDYCKSQGVSEEMIKLILLYDGLRNEGEKQRLLIEQNPDLKTYFFKIFLKAPLRKITINKIERLQTILKEAIGNVRIDTSVNFELISSFPRICEKLFSNKNGKQVQNLLSFIFSKHVQVDKASIQAFENCKAMDDLDEFRDINKKENIVESEPVIQLGDTKKYLEEQLVDEFVVGYLNKQKVFSHFRADGNTILHLAFKDRESEVVTNFVVSYVLRSLEESSIGSLNIHFLDKNDEWIFKRLKNCFDKMGKTESLKKIISITDDEDAIFNQIGVVVDDVSKKILNLPVSSNNPDFYQLYSEDKNDALHLVVISSGFFDMISDGSATKISIIKEYVKQNSKGHKSGVRFLIVDDSNDRQDFIPDSNKVLCKTIYDNCELNILFDGKSFSIKNEPFLPILIHNDLDAFVCKLGEELASAVLNKQENEIHYDKIGFGKETHCELGPTISIPIGLSGTDIVSVPLSCSDRNNSAEGSNIGFMVIGMSGSGKSTFMHSLIINGCIKYSPKDLQFWLLDFKSGNATEKYLKANIPHIHVITENNKADDAFSIFNMLLDEMERRNGLFKKNNFSDVYSYNLFAKEHPEKNLEYLPRIIICIDEIQELFVDEQSHQLAQLIGRISSRMRVCGMHFVFISQNLSMDKTPYLVDAFLKHANGRVCFRISAEDTARNSHYPDEFIERDSELRTLSTCAAYVSYGPGTIKKVNVCRCTDELFKKYFSEIRKTYSEYECKTLIIGSRKRLSLNTLITSVNKKYLEYILDLKDKYSLVLAENTYTLQPVELKITPNNNSSLFCLGSDNIMMSSICAMSTICGLLNKGMTVHLMNGQ